MFKELFSAMRQDSLLDKAYERSYEMIDLTEHMFSKAVKSLEKGSKPKQDLEVIKLDKKINQYEQEVRRMILQHLAVGSNADLHSALTLLNVVIDLERIGDYTKNMVEMAENYHKKLKKGKQVKELNEVIQAVEDSFKRTRKILESGSEEEAATLVKDYDWVNPYCDDRLNEMLKNENKKLSSRDAVALSLYYRYLKRINSHLRNVVTGACCSFEKFGFVPRKLRKNLKTKKKK